MARQRKLPTGMIIREKTYYANFRRDGRRIRKRLSTDFTTAKVLLNDLRARVDRGDFGFLDLDYPWDELKSMFLRWAKSSIRHPEDYERDLRLFEGTRLEGFTPIRNVRDVTAQRVDAFCEYWLTHESAPKNPRTINRIVGTIKNLLNKGVKRFKVLDHNPLEEVKPLDHVEMAKERRSLTVEEVDSLFEHSPEHLEPVWRMFMTTGIRKGELVKLKFSDVDWDRQSITIRAANAKNKKAREIPLTDETMELLVDLREQAPEREPVPGCTPKQTAQQAASFSREHVFVNQANTPLRNNLLRTFYGICERAGIEGAERCGKVDIHSLRVSFITLSLERGASPKAVQAIVGHATLTMTMNVYAKATDRSKRDAIGVLPFATVSPPKHLVEMTPAELKDSVDPEMTPSSSDSLQLVTA